MVEALTGLLVDPDDGISAMPQCSLLSIAEAVGSQQLECASTRSGIDIWFSPLGYCREDVNRYATEILVATGEFSTYRAPLLRGIVVVTGHDHAGAPIPLASAHLRQLIRGRPKWPSAVVLFYRVVRDQARRCYRGKRPVRL